MRHRTMRHLRLLALGTLTLVIITILEPNQSLGKSGSGNSQGTFEDDYRPVQLPASVAQERKGKQLPPPVPIVIDEVGSLRAQQSEDTMPAEPRIFNPKPITTCPKTIVLNLSAAAPASTTPNPTDFPPPPPPPTSVASNFGFSTPNTHLRHTFSFPGPCQSKLCCEIQKATLQLQVKALQAGQSQQSPNAGNDKWYISKNGTVLASGFIWSTFPVTPGQTQTLTIPIQPAWLDGCRLSFMTQDDTSVTEAKLTVIGCCVRPNMSTTAP